MPSRFRVLVEGSSSPGSAGSGICLTQTITFIRRQCYRAVQTAPNPARAHDRCDACRSRRRERIPSGALRVLLVVNSFASSVTARNTVVVHRRLSRGHDVETRRDQPARPRHPLRPRRRPPRRRRRRRLRRRRHAQRGRHRDRRHRHRARRAARRVDERVRPHDRHAERPGRGGRAAGGRHRRRRLPTDRPRPGQRPVLLLPHRHRLRRRRRRTGGDAGPRSSAGSATRCSSRAGVTTWLTGYDRQHPHFRVSGDGGRDVDDGYFSIVLNTNPYTYLGNRPLDLSPAATLDQPLVAITFTTMSATAILQLARRRAARRRGQARIAPRHPRRACGISSSSTTSRSRTRSTVTPWAPLAGSSSPRARRGAARVPDSSRSSVGTTERSERDRRDVGAHGVDAERGQLDEAFGVVARPGVHPQPGLVTALDRRRIERPLPRMDRGMPTRRPPGRSSPVRS